MPILFSVSEESPIFSSTWCGTITVSEMLQAYTEFFEGPDWKGRALEYADFSEADLSRINVAALQKLCELIADTYSEHGIEHARCASWIPRDINRSLLEIYGFLSEKSPEVTRVFSSKSAAMNWLERGDEPQSYDHRLEARAS
ncbi:MAG: hypothetical protein ACPGN3_15265 [Opitutales bacterium]